MSSGFSGFNSQLGGSLPSFGGGARGFSFRQTTRLNEQTHDHAMAILDKLHAHATAEASQGHTALENLTRMQHFHEASESSKLQGHTERDNAAERIHLETLEGIKGTNETARVKAEGKRERAKRKAEAVAVGVETGHRMAETAATHTQGMERAQQTHDHGTASSAQTHTQTMAEAAQEHTQRLEAERQAPKTMTRMTAGSSITTSGPKGSSTTITKGAPNTPAKKAAPAKRAPRPPRPPRA